MRSNGHKDVCTYCEHSPKDATHIWCIDCGIYLIVKPNDINTCRCKECQKEHRKTANRERQKRYRDSKKNSVEVNF